MNLTIMRGLHTVKEDDVFQLHGVAHHAARPHQGGTQEARFMDLTITALLDLSHTLAGDYLAQFQYPWEALDGIKELILQLDPALDPAE